MGRINSPYYQFVTRRTGRFPLHQARVIFSIHVITCGTMSGNLQLPSRLSCCVGYSNHRRSWHARRQQRAFDLIWFDSSPTNHVIFCLFPLNSTPTQSLADNNKPLSDNNAGSCLLRKKKKNTLTCVCVFGSGLSSSWLQQTHLTALILTIMCFVYTCYQNWTFHTFLYQPRW